MKTLAASLSLLIALTCLSISDAEAQSAATDTAQSIPKENGQYAEAYLTSRISSLERYLSRSGRIQKRMLKKLAKAERKLAAAVPDSLKNKFNEQERDAFNTDSVAARSSDSATLRELAQKKNKVIDSLKGVQSFLSSNLSKAGNIAGKAPGEDYTEKLNDLQQQLNLQEQAGAWMEQRRQSLGGLANTHNLPVVSKLQKLQRQAMAAGQKIKYWKELSDDPDKAEEEAWEIPQRHRRFRSLPYPERNACLRGIGQQCHGRRPGAHGLPDQAADRRHAAGKVRGPLRRCAAADGCSN